MLRIAHWAQAHLRLAQLLLIPIHVLLIMVSIRLGLALDLGGVDVPEFAPHWAAIIILLGFLAYPYGKAAARATWRRRKLAEATLLTGVVVTVALLAAHIVAAPVGPAAIAPQASPSAQLTSLTYPAATPDGTTAEPSRRDRRLWRRAVRAKAKDYLHRQQGKIDGWGAGLLIFLTVVLASFLEVLVLALSCSIACNGAEGAAIIVGLLGTAGVIFLAVLAIGSILRAYRRSRDPDNPNVRRKRSPRTKVLQ